MISYLVFISFLRFSRYLASSYEIHLGEQATKYLSPLYPLPRVSSFNLVIPILASYSTKSIADLSTLYILSVTLSGNLSLIRIDNEELAKTGRSDLINEITMFLVLNASFNSSRYLKLSLFFVAIQKSSSSQAHSKSLYIY